MINRLFNPSITLDFLIGHAFCDYPLLSNAPGVRALASPGGVLPRVEGMPGVTVEALHEAHIVLRTDDATPLGIGDQFLLHSGQQDIMVSRWDQIIAVRQGVVEAVWDLPARGCHH